MTLGSPFPAIDWSTPCPVVEWVKSHAGMLEAREAERAQAQQTQQTQRPGPAAKPASAAKVKNKTWFEGRKAG